MNIISVPVSVMMRVPMLLMTMMLGIEVRAQVTDIASGVPVISMEVISVQVTINGIYVAVSTVNALSI